MYNNIKETADFLSREIGAGIETAIVLGSGLGRLAAEKMLHLLQGKAEQPTVLPWSME